MLVFLMTRLKCPRSAWHIPLHIPELWKEKSNVPNPGAWLQMIGAVPFFGMGNGTAYVKSR